MKNLKIAIIALTAIVLSSVSFNSNAQGLYINAGLGYGLNAASQSLGDNMTTTQGTTSSTTSHSLVKGSFAAGLNFGVGFGYMFNEHFGAELGINYLSGSTIKVTNTQTGTGYSSISNYNLNATMIRIIPAIKMSGEPGTVVPYIKAGMVIGISGKITNKYDNTTTSSLSTDISNSTTEYTGGSSIGFMAAIGMDYKLSDMVGIYAEIGMIGATWAPTDGLITAATSNGADQLSKMTTHDKETTYSDSYTDPTTVSDGTPSQSLKQFEPFSSWGINIGIHLMFGGGAK